ncbi:hypothetical protein ABID29_000234 [Streptococcus rupicaprae]|uniref:Transposase n=1 Tax=Streptococcus rupicaprae TaxID=759619 RepID=A0ABV2FEX8_9STRE
MTLIDGSVYTIDLTIVSWSNEERRLAFKKFLSYYQQYGRSVV